MQKRVIAVLIISFGLLASFGYFYLYDSSIQLSSEIRSESLESQSERFQSRQIFEDGTLSEALESLENGPEITEPSEEENHIFNGYIAILPAPSIVEKETSGAKQAELDLHKNVIRQEQDSFKDTVRTLPRGEVTGSVENVLNAVFFNIDEERLNQLKNSFPDAEFHPNYQVHATLTDSIPIINADDVWQLDADGNLCNVQTSPQIFTEYDSYSSSELEDRSLELAKKYQNTNTVREKGLIIQELEEIAQTIQYQSSSNLKDPSCPADFNGDDVVDAADLATLLSSWGDCPGCPADFNGDDVVDAADLATFLSSWGPCPATDCLTGTGVTIGIIDTGVDYTHQDLGGCFSNLPNNCNGYLLYDQNPVMIDGIEISVWIFGEENENIIVYVDGEPGMVPFLGVTEVNGLSILNTGSHIFPADPSQNYAIIGVGDQCYGSQPDCVYNGLCEENLGENPDNCPFDCGGGDSCKVQGGYDFVQCNSFNNNGDCVDPQPEDPDPMDQMGHGTHVAATAAGNGYLKGVAPDAKISAYRVLNNDGVGEFSWIIAGIERAVLDEADIISLSLGGTSFPDPDDPQSQAIDNAVEAGVVAVVAAGNQGQHPTAPGYSEYGYGPFHGTINTPGVARKAITVGSVEKNLEIADYSSRGPARMYELAPEPEHILLKPDVVAPGGNVDYSCSSCDPNCCRYPEGILAATPESPLWSCLGSACGETSGEFNYVKLSGTSMATPHVAGLVALIKQRNPTYTPGQIKSAIKNTADNLPSSETLENQGFGLVNSLDAVFLDDPIAVELREIERSPVFDIIGSIYGGNFDHYTLSIAQRAPLSEITVADWFLITSSTTIPSDEILFSNFDIDAMPDGEYIIKLEAFDTQGRSFIDYGFAWWWTEFECFDSDVNLEFPDGLNTYEGGTILFLQPEGEIGIKFDACFDLVEPDQIMESYCTDSNSNGQELLDCEGHCILAGRSYCERRTECIQNSCTYVYESGNDGCTSESSDCTYSDNILWAAETDNTIINLIQGIDSIEDINGDSIDEIVISSYDNELSDNRVYAFSGLDGQTIWQSDILGWGSGGVFKIQDINNDDIDDVVAHITGSPTSLRALSGIDGSLIWDLPVADLGKQFRASDIVPDLDDDGFDDIVVADTGGVYVISSNSGELIWWIEDDQNGWSYRDVDSIEDVNGDGYSDVIVGTLGNVCPGPHDWTYVYSGVDGVLIWSRGPNFGVNVESIENENGDGEDVLSAANCEFSTGDSYLYRLNGENGQTIWSFEDERCPEDLEFWVVEVFDDVNGDGMDDVLTVSFPTPISCEGRLYLLDGLTGEEIWSKTEYATYKVIRIDDNNGDGIMDVAVGNDNFVHTLRGDTGDLIWSLEKDILELKEVNDLNGNGISDIIITSDHAGVIYALDGSG